MQNLVIDREAGTYSFDLEGKPRVTWPSVTHIINETVAQYWSGDQALDRGRYVHKACALIDGWGGGSGLDRESLDPALAPYVGNYDYFLSVTGFVPVFVECSVYSEKYQYAGMPDRLGYFPRPKDKRLWVVLEIKTVGVYPWTGIQLAAYRQGIIESWRHKLPCRPHEIGCAAIGLDPTRTPKPQFYDDHAGDLSMFLSLSTKYRWGKKYGC